jgi:hypothetical protein
MLILEIVVLEGLLPVPPRHGMMRLLMIFQVIQYNLRCLVKEGDSLK